MYLKIVSCIRIQVSGYKKDEYSEEEIFNLNL